MFLSLIKYSLKQKYYFYSADANVDADADLLVPPQNHNDLYLMAPVDQNIIRRAISSYIYTLKIKIHVKDNTSNFIIFTIILETFANLGGRGFQLLGKECIVR